MSAAIQREGDWRWRWGLSIVRQPCAMWNCTPLRMPTMSRVARQERGERWQHCCSCQSVALLELKKIPKKGVGAGALVLRCCPLPIEKWRMHAIVWIELRSSSRSLFGAERGFVVNSWRHRAGGQMEKIPYLTLI